MLTKATKRILVLFVIELLSRTNSLAVGRFAVTNPIDGSVAPWRACLIGETDDPTAEHIAVVHPLEGAYHVQPPITIRPDGRFKAMLFIGDEGLHQGQLFEIRVFRGPHRKYRQGEILKAWPAANVESGLVEVTRQDDAPSGCGNGREAPAVAAPEGYAVAAAPSNNATDPASRMAAREKHAEPFFLSLFLWLAPTMLVLLFIAMAALEGRAKKADDYLRDRLETFRKWLTLHQERRVTKSVRAAVRLFVYGLRHIKIIWQNRGFAGNLGRFAGALLLSGVLLGLAVIASFVDVKAMAPALTAMYGRPTTARAATLAFTEPSDDQPVGSSAVLPKVNAPSPLKGFGERVAADMVRLWTDEPNGQFAVGIAAVQASFGLVLLNGFPLAGLLVLTPAKIYRARPMLSILFMILNLGLAALAAFRGFELSPGDHWVVPCMVSASIGLGMPWVMAYSLHFGTNYAIECLGVLFSVASVVGVAHLGLAAQLILLAALIVLLGPLYCAFAAVFLFRLAAGLLLWMAIVLGELAREIRPPWGDRAVAKPLGALAALAVAAMLTLSGFALTRWLV
jgi:hypothetical protein